MKNRTLKTTPQFPPRKPEAPKVTGRRGAGQKKLPPNAYAGVPDLGPPKWLKPVKHEVLLSDFDEPGDTDG